jgi:hypothetical protein
MPNRVAIAPAVLRIRNPRPTASSPITVRYSAAPTMARSAPGVLNVAWMCVLASACWPSRNATNADTRVTRKTSTANTIALAMSTGSRCGTAASEERIIPVLYSPVITSTPRTPIASWARKTPRRLTSVGSKPNLFS